MSKNLNNRKGVEATDDELQKASGGTISELRYKNGTVKFRVTKAKKCNDWGCAYGVGIPHDGLFNPVHEFDSKEEAVRYATSHFLSTDGHIYVERDDRPFGIGGGTHWEILH